MTTDLQSVVIVGTGAAGYAVAEGLHSAGFGGAVTLVGEELDEPYDRPPLSKEVLSGAWDRERAALIGAKRAAPLNPRVLTGVQAMSLDVEGHRLALSNGERLDYDSIVIATGVTPRRLEYSDSANIRVLRTMDDALALRALLGGNPRLLVVGGGFLGLEVAATARGLGATVTVVEPIPGPPLASRIGTVAATKLQAVHADRGVEIHTGVGVSALEAEAGGTPVHATLGDGTTVEADVVLIAVGSVPATQWLESSGVELANGVVCDEFCSAGNDVWAAGDVASWLHVGYDLRMRLEHRTNAQEQGLAVGRNIVGPRVAFTPVPYFWTNQYDVRIQVHGHVVDLDHAEVTEGDSADSSFVQTFSEHGRVTAALGWNAARLMAGYRKQLLEAMPG